MAFKGSKPSYVALGKLLNLFGSQFPSSSQIKYANIWGALSSGLAIISSRVPQNLPPLQSPAPPPSFSKNSTNTKDSPTLAQHTFVQEECFLLYLANSYSSRPSSGRVSCRKSSWSTNSHVQLALLPVLWEFLCFSLALLSMLEMHMSLTMNFLLILSPLLKD